MAKLEEQLDQGNVVKYAYKVLQDYSSDDSPSKQKKPSQLAKRVKKQIAKELQMKVDLITVEALDK